MEVYVFMVFIGLWMAMLLIGVGYVLAKTDDHYHQKRNKDNSEHVHDGHSDNCVCSGRDSDLLARPMGDIHGEEHSRCNCRMVREMTNDALAAVLRAIVIAESLTPYEEEYLEEAAKRIEKEGEHDNND